MGVLIIGVVSVTMLIWTMTSSLAAECDAEKRRGIQIGELSGDRAHGTTSVQFGQAA